MDAELLEAAERLGDRAGEFAGKTVVITGAAGFLGQYFCGLFKLLNSSRPANPVRVVALDNFIASTAERPESHPHFQFHTHNVIEPFSFDGKIDFILHAAGIASPRYYRQFPLETMDVAVHGTRRMLELAKSHDARILFFSSSEIYGDPDPAFVPTPETYRGNVATLGPRACYDESKRLGETMCAIYAGLYKTQAKIVRPFNVYGPGMRENDYRVLPNFASSLAAQRTLSVYGDGRQTRTFCYITDALDGFLRVLLYGRAGEPYNIGNAKPEVSMRELVKTMERALGRSVPVQFSDYPAHYPADEPQRRCPDLRKAQSELGFEPQIDLLTGVTRFLNWALANYKGQS